MERCVSVVIPAYNAARTLDRALESVAIQGQWIKETLLVDDGSTDNTFDIAQRYSWVTAICQPHRGAAAARNLALKAASGSVIAFLDADDEWLPGKITAQMEVISAHPEVGFVSTDFFKRLLDGSDIRGYQQHRDVYDMPAIAEGPVRFLQREVFQRLLVCLYTATPTVAVRKEIIDQIGPFDLRFSVAEDFDFYLRCARATRFAAIDVPLAYVHYQPNSLGSDDDIVLSETLRMLESFEVRNGVLRYSERKALNRRVAQLLLTIGYRAKQCGRVGAALRYYGRSFLTAPGWRPVRCSVGAIGSAMLSR